MNDSYHDYAYTERIGELRQLSKGTTRPKRTPEQKAFLDQKQRELAEAIHARDNDTRETIADAKRRVRAMVTGR